LHPNDLLDLTVSSAEGTETGDTKITVTPAALTGDSYKYKVGTSAASVTVGQTLTTGWTAWNGTDDITAETGKVITVAEVDGSNKAVGAGHATVTAKA